MVLEVEDKNEASEVPVLFAHVPSKNSVDTFFHNCLLIAGFIVFVVFVFSFSRLTSDISYLKNALLGTNDESEEKTKKDKFNVATVRGPNGTFQIPSRGTNVIPDNNFNFYDNGQKKTLASYFGLSRKYGYDTKDVTQNQEFGLPNSFSPDYKPPPPPPSPPPQASSSLLNNSISEKITPKRLPSTSVWNKTQHHLHHQLSKIRVFDKRQKPAAIPGYHYPDRNRKSETEHPNLLTYYGLPKQKRSSAANSASACSLNENTTFSQSSYSRYSYQNNNPSATSLSYGYPKRDATFFGIGVTRDQEQDSTYYRRCRHGHNHNCSPPNYYGYGHNEYTQGRPRNNTREPDHYHHLGNNNEDIPHSSYYGLYKIYQ